MIKYYYKNIRNKTASTLEEFKKGSWICVEKPSEKEIKQLAEQFNLEEGHLTDAIDPYEVPRIEIEDDILYIYTRYACEINNKISTLPMLVVLGEDFVLTITNQKNTSLQKILETPNFTTTQKIKLMIQMFLHINKDFNSTVHKISKNIKNYSSNLETIQNKDIANFVEIERILNDFLSALVPTSMIYDNIIKSKHFPLYENDEDLVEDLLLSTKQLIEITKSNIKNIVNIRETYTAIMTNKLNKTMKVLTSITVILTIPTIISSFYGMNMALPFAQDPQAYLGVILGSIGLSILMIIIFFKNKLL